MNPLIRLTIRSCLALTALSFSTLAEEHIDPDHYSALLRMAHQYLAVEPITGFPYEVSEDEAYELQKTFNTLLKPALGDVIGYKTGGHSAPGGAFPPWMPTEPLRGVYLEGMLFENGSTLKKDMFVSGSIEPDILIRVGDPKLLQAETEQEIIERIDAIVPFLELIDFMVVPKDNARKNTIILDQLTRHGVTGEPIPIEPTDKWITDLKKFTVTTWDENDQPIKTSAMTSERNFFEIIAWLMNKYREVGNVELKKGDLISLGSIALPLMIPINNYKGDKVSITYEGLDLEVLPRVTVYFEQIDHEKP